MISTRKMVLIGWACIVIFFGFTMAMENKTVLNEDLEVVEIESGVFVVIHSAPWPANSLLVKLSPTDFILVDTPWDNFASQRLHEWLTKQFGQVRLVVVNTHFHRDCLGGNHYFISQKIPVYAADLTEKLFREKGRMRAESSLEYLKKRGFTKHYENQKNSPLAPPDHIFKIKEGLTLTISNESIEIFYPGPGHTEDNVVVYFPSRKILFGGCILKALKWKSLGYLGDAVPEKWGQSLHNILEKFKDSRIVIPGHGQWGDLDIVRHTQELVTRYNKDGNR